MIIKIVEFLIRPIAVQVENRELWAVSEAFNLPRMLKKIKLDIKRRFNLPRMLKNKKLYKKKIQPF